MWIQCRGVENADSYSYLMKLFIPYNKKIDHLCLQFLVGEGKSLFQLYDDVSIFGEDNEQTKKQTHNYGKSKDRTQFRAKKINP